MIAKQFAIDLKYYNSALTYSENNSIGEAANDILQKLYSNFIRIDITNNKKATMITKLVQAFNEKIITVPHKDFYKDMNYELSIFTFELLPLSHQIRYWWNDSI